MKLIFFLIAFCLISVLSFISWTGNDKEKRGESNFSMVIRSDNYNEDLKYSGKIVLTEDETGFKSISPGGYFKFVRNDQSVKAVSNLRGDIEYSIYDGKNKLALDEQGRKLLIAAVKEMIAQGFDAGPRMERIYQKGGSSALLREADSMKSDQIKILYLNHVFEVDTTLEADLPIIVKEIGSLSSDMDKEDLLKRIPNALLKNPSVSLIYFDVVKGMGSDLNKANSLQYFMDQDSLSDENSYKILDLSGWLGSDLDKEDLYREMIEKGLIYGPRFDSLLMRVSNLGSDLDKSNLYKMMTGIINISENQWIGLIDKVTGMGSDMDKSNLLIEISQKMPKTVAVKSIYMKTARTISDDGEYGKVVRAVE